MAKRKSFLIDTDCLIALLCSWHEHHEPVLREVERRLRRGEEMVLSGWVLLESYDRLTRLPPPHRLAPEQAWKLLEGNFRAFSVVMPSEEDLWEILREAARDQRLRVSLLLHCARKAGASGLLTLHAEGWGSVQREGVEIWSPSFV